MKTTVLALLLALPAALSAQSVEIVPGRRMRVETARSSIAGALSTQTADSLVLIGKGSTRIAVPTGEITGIRLSEGKSHGLGALKGMGYGAAILGGGAAVLVAAGGDPEWAPVFAGVGGVYGVVIGGIIGAIAGAEKWTAVQSTLPRVSVGTTPQGATRVGLSISF